jgi:two-component system sensor histidine kinase RpfC
MNLSTVQARLSNRSDSEHQQALIRIVLLGMIVLYMWVRPSLDGDSRILLLGLAGFFALAIGIFIAIWLWPAPNAPRRVLGMVADVGAISFALLLAGESGVGLVGVYLFVVFGNGFRYGRKSLFVCQLLCVAAFTVVLFAAPWWKEHPYVGYLHKR